MFPCATGDTNYIGGAVETIEALRLIKENIPYVKTALGVSNISFGLPAAAREVVNSVFLYYCTKAGLDLAIVNAEKLERFASIPEEERHLAENAAVQYAAGLEARTPRGLARADAGTEGRRSTSITSRRSPNSSAAHAGKRKQRRRICRSIERLANYIIEGTKEGLIADLDLKRAEGAAPLDIINGPLMAGMAEVGRLFNANELIVAEVLQSAEAMKAAVNYLEQFMEKADTASRGKIVLATVKGDVHDIGKNLVEIILSNNGYTVVNLGIKIPSDQLDSGVPRTSAGRHRALRPAGEERAADGADGGRFQEKRAFACRCWWAARRFRNVSRNTRSRPRIGEAVCYAKDAMTGLRLMNQLMDPTEREAVLRRTQP